MRIAFSARLTIAAIACFALVFAAELRAADLIPMDVAVDAGGNVYISDFNHRILKVDAVGTVSTVAGNGTPGFSGDGGPAANALLNSPKGIALDTSGNLYIVDGANRRVRKVAAAGGIINTVAGTNNGPLDTNGGPATEAAFYNPYDIAVDASANLYVVDLYRVRKVDALSGTISTFAGNGKVIDLTGPDLGGDGGPATAIALAPVAVAWDAGGSLFITDAFGVVRRVDAASGLIFNVSGHGRPMAFDGRGNLHIGDGYRIRKVDAASGAISTVAGTGESGFSGDGGPATAAMLGSTTGLAFDANGNLFLADYDNHRVRKIDAASGTIATVLGPTWPPPGLTGRLAVRYRLYNPGTFEHLYTIDSNEYAALPMCCGWTTEGAIYQIFSGPGSFGGVAAVPYYRLYNPLSFQHHWTTNASEYDFLPSVGWKQEGIDGYILPTPVEGAVPLYRLSLNASDVLPTPVGGATPLPSSYSFGGLRLWTTDLNEVNHLVTNAGWVNNGAVGYVIPYPPTVF